MTRRRAGARERAPVLALAVAIYLPLLATAPGRVGADTKSYLYLDPGRLLSRAWSMWDPSVGLGTVSHQTIGYLWPMGPWFWAFDRLGVPDWVAQRLWLGSILFAAGTGVLWLLRRVLGWSTPAATVAAFAYACTPYVLTLAARLSAILLPFAGLPWLLGLTILALRRGGWRHPALFALVVATVGSVNATALVLVGVAPLWWLVHTRLTRAASTPQVLGTVARIGVLTVAANLWWLAGLYAQGGWGIDILRYTETAEVVASASNGAEVLRGLGYWFFYGGDRLGPWIEPAADYTQRLPLLVLTYALPIAALAAAGLVRFRHRSFFVGLVAIGTVLAVGAHPWDQPPVGGGVIKSFLLSDLGLAMRSLPRAAPLVALGLAACLGAGAECVATHLAARSSGRWAGADRGRLRVALPTVAAVLVYLALPPLWSGGMVATNLDRPSELPAYWGELAEHLDAGDRATRVLEVPGADFASYRWGNTVDPVTPGITDRSYAARELIPYGTPASADLLSALDRRIQEGTLEPGALAAVARLLGVGEIVLRDDLQFERYRTPRPYQLSPFLAAEDGLGSSRAFGAPVVNAPVAEVPLLDEQALALDDGVARPPVEVFAVEDPEPVVRVRALDGGVVLAGDGEGLVDAAAAGLLDGHELVRYAAALGGAAVADALAGGARLVITDGNRVQGRRWSTVRDVLGAVEPPAGLAEDLTDNRLPVFPDAEEGWATTAAAGTLTVAATSYGNSISFTPEYRPAHAADGDLATEWRTGASADVRGEELELRPSSPTEVRAVRLVQQLTGFRNRHITEVELRFGSAAAPLRATLDDRSLTAAGQAITLPAGVVVEEVTVEVLADSSGRTGSWGRPVRFNGLSQVGFAEVSLLGESGATVGRTDPALALAPSATAAIGAEGQVALVLTRWRAEATDPVRADPEAALARRWALPVPRSFSLGGTARLSPRAADALLASVLGADGPVVEASSHLTGVAAALGSAALDGDPATWWSPGFEDPAPALTVRTATPVTIDSLTPVLVADGRRSVITTLRVEVDGAPAATVELPPGGGPVALTAPLTGSTFRFVVAATEARTTTEWYSGSEVVVPPAIAELGIPVLAVEIPATFDTGCRDDLLAVDGSPVGLRVQGTTAAALGGAPLQVEACAAGVGASVGVGVGVGAVAGALALGTGAHDLRATPGATTGIDLDQLVLHADSTGSAAAGGADAAATPLPTVTVVRDERARLHLSVTGATPGQPFWLVLGQSHSPGWQLDGVEPTLVDGYANGWIVDPDRTELTIDLVWAPQRVVNLALAASILAVLGCALLALLGRRRPGEPDEPDEPDEPGEPHNHGEPHPAEVVHTTFGARRDVAAVVVVGGCAVGAVLVIGPLAGAVVATVGAAMAWGPLATRRWLRLAPAASYAVAALYIVVRQAVARPTAAFEWPAEQATAHQPALVAIALLVLTVALPAPSTPDHPPNLHPDRVP